MPRQKKEFKCGHRGFGRYCHFCQSVSYGHSSSSTYSPIRSSSSGPLSDNRRRDLYETNERLLRSDNPSRLTLE